MWSKKELREIAPGIDLEKDILALMEFRPAISSELTEMDPAIFQPDTLDLRNRAPKPLGERLSYAEGENVLYCNFEGLALKTVKDANELASRLDEEFRGIGRRVKVVVNYDNFDITPEAAPIFFQMIADNEKYVLSRTRYSANAFFRRRLGRQFTAASLQHRLYGNFEAARKGMQLEENA